MSENQVIKKIFGRKKDKSVTIYTGYTGQLVLLRVVKSWRMQNAGRVAGLERRDMQIHLHAEISPKEVRKLSLCLTKHHAMKTY
jgi:hypothetical protein